MTDDGKATPTELDAPMAVFVRGGTTSSAHDRLMYEQHADAERRRAQQDAQARAARTGELPKHLTGDDISADGAPAVTRMSSLKLGGKDYASIVLVYLRPRDKQPLHYITCELTPGTSIVRGKPELVLNMCCLRCIFRRGVRMESAQIKIAQSNRWWELDIKRAGELWVNPDDPAEVVTLAGTVWCDDAPRCPQCDWRFRISNSVIEPL